MASRRLQSQASWRGDRPCTSYDDRIPCVADPYCSWGKNKGCYWNPYGPAGNWSKLSFEKKAEACRAIKDRWGRLRCEEELVQEVRASAAAAQPERKEVKSVVPGVCGKYGREDCNYLNDYCTWDGFGCTTKPDLKESPEELNLDQLLKAIKESLQAPEVKRTERTRTYIAPELLQSASRNVDPGRQLYERLKNKDLDVRLEDIEQYMQTYQRDRQIPANQTVVELNDPEIWRLYFQARLANLLDIQK